MKNPKSPLRCLTGSREQFSSSPMLFSVWKGSITLFIVGAILMIFVFLPVEMELWRAVWKGEQAQWTPFVFTSLDRKLFLLAILFTHCGASTATCASMLVYFKKPRIIPKVTFAPSSSIPPQSSHNP